MARKTKCLIHIQRLAHEKAGTYNGTYKGWQENVHRLAENVHICIHIHIHRLAENVHTHIQRLAGRMMLYTQMLHVESILHCLLLI
jgi:hypothetical protein